MGGKTKQAPRTKNNARPSNSGRSAELLGTAVPTFVGFATHSDLGMIPFAPGFSTVDTLPETFESSINSEFQVIFRKLSKKDPVTKTKALQELNSQLLESDIETVKTILPLWPKFYHNLSNDVEHRVREAVQTAQSTLTQKAGKNIAPFIKQLVPIWIASRFDNYSPAGSIACASFKSAFPPHKIQEVLLYCQNEFIDYITKNLTFHTASTLSNLKIVTAEDAESKYQRVIISSMKALCLFIELTSTKENLNIDDKCVSLMQHQKLWSYSKHKVIHIRAAFYELLCTVLQYTPRYIEQNKNQVIQNCFQHMDDIDPFTSPNIWGCILIIQTIFVDWHEQISFKKIQPKFSNIFKSIQNGEGGSSLSKNFLPFLSKLCDSSIKDLQIYEFLTEFFKNIKNIILSAPENANIRKSDINTIIMSYFECLRYIFKNMSEDIKENKSLNQVSVEFLQKFILDLLMWSFDIESMISKMIYKNCSALIAYWASIANEIQLYSNLLAVFWKYFLEMITNISKNKVNETNLKNIIELITHLYKATPSLQDNKVMFGDGGDKDANKLKYDLKKKCSKYVAEDLKKIALEIVKIYMERLHGNIFTSQITILCFMFGDIDFYKQLSCDENILTTLTKFIKFVDESPEPAEDFIDVIFEIINILDEKQKLEQMKLLIKLENLIVQQWVLQRIMSPPLSGQPAIKEITQNPDFIPIILRITREAVEENSEEKFNLIEKYFVQNYLITQCLVEKIISIVIQPFHNISKNEECLSRCCIFLKNLMPVICNNISIEFKNKFFLELFKFSIDSLMEDCFSTDILHEITSCWQNSISNNNIILDQLMILECNKIFENKLNSGETEISVSQLDGLAELIVNLIILSAHAKYHPSNDKNNFEEKLLENIGILLKFNENDKKNLQNLNNICKFYETIGNCITIDNIINDYCTNLPLNLLRNFFRKIYFLFSALYKLTCDEKFCEKNNANNANEILLDDNEPKRVTKLVKWPLNVVEIFNNCIAGNFIGESLFQNSKILSNDINNIILKMTQKINQLMEQSSDVCVNSLKNNIIEHISTGNILWLRPLKSFLITNFYQQYNESGPIVFMEELSDQLLPDKKYEIYNNLAEIFFPYLPLRSLILNEEFLLNADNIKFQSSFLRNIIKNHMSSNNYFQLEDKNIVSTCIKFINQVGEKQSLHRDIFLYNEDISGRNFNDVIVVIEYIKLLTEAVKRFASELNIKNWDSIRIGLSSWVLTVSKSAEKYEDAKVALFITAVYDLFSALAKFIELEKTKSSTSFNSNVIDEWENVFAKEVNLILFRNYVMLVQCLGIRKMENDCLNVFIERIASCAETIDFIIIFNACQSGYKLNVNDLVQFALDNLCNLQTIRKTSVSILKKIAIPLIRTDLEKFEKNNETLNAMEKSANEVWHFLKKYQSYFEKYSQPLEKYIDEFSFKLSELEDFTQIKTDEALTYFYLWDCIIFVFSKAPAELKSLYATWITDNKFENVILNFIFRAMPLEILRNHDKKTMSNDIVKTACEEKQFQDGKISIEKTACYIYIKMLRHLPVIVRKWWNDTHPRQQAFIDKLTTNYFSNLLWQEDLANINKGDKHENMQITVHQSTREIMATYMIDEARMELIIKLPQNHPLGVIKVEMGKQIGGKSTTRNIGMQLTIFLTHQNGSIFDGLALWKKNLDKKFAGVEECYICYTVIHQDTCQLPKLTCKTCRKKFHAPCLYKWFTTSSKSTCPLCRNVF